MARTVKEEKYVVRRNEILDSAQRLVQTKGYEQMSIQDILDERHMSKGAFYHYFDSKHDLLEAIVFQRMEGIEQIITPIIQDTTLSAIEKFQAYFASASNWKVSQKPFLLDLLQVWYNDDNAIVRQKITARMVVDVTPFMIEIIQQGIREGAFNVTYPRQIGEVVLSMVQSYGEALVMKLLAFNRQPGNPQDLIDSVGAYNEAIERILGMSRGSLNLVNFGMIEEWMVTSEEKT